MADDERGILGNPQATGEQIRMAWEQAALTAMQVHLKTNVPVATWDWENGQVVMLSPEDESISQPHAMTDATSARERS